MRDDWTVGDKFRPGSAELQPALGEGGPYGRAARKKTSKFIVAKTEF